MSGSTRARIGIVGAGIRGTMFVQALASHPAAEAVAICDRDEATRERARATLGLTAHADHVAMLDATPDLDAVIVATPDFAHRDAAVDAAARGLHLLVEKPLASTVEDAVAIHDAVEAAGVRCMVGFENRWNPRFVAARQLIAAGELGDLLTMTASLHDTTFVPTKMLPWAARSSPAWFLMPHSLDLLLWLSGKSPATVVATGVRKRLVDLGVDTWDTIDALWTFTDGTTAALHSGWVLPESFPSVYDLRVELIGTASALRIQVADQGLDHFTPAGLRWPQWGLLEDRGRVRGFPVDMTHAFVDWVLTGEGDVPTSRQGVRITRALAAVHASLDSGAPVALGEA